MNVNDIRTDLVRNSDTLREGESLSIITAVVASKDNDLSEDSGEIEVPHQYNKIIHFTIDTEYIQMKKQ